MPKTKWWLGQRGEWYVVVQILLMMLVVFGPAGWPGLPEPYRWLGKWSGGVLISTGAVLSLLAALRLGSNLTVLPRPKDDGDLTVSGPYRLVRHPIYSGVILAAFGWALWVNGWLTMGYALLLFFFFDIKSRREELWLMEKFPGYREYRQRVRKLIPLLY